MFMNIIQFCIFSAFTLFFDAKNQPWLCNSYNTINTNICIYNNYQGRETSEGFHYFKIPTTYFFLECASENSDKKTGRHFVIV